jgi:hypothetical protein
MPERCRSPSVQVQNEPYYSVSFYLADNLSPAKSQSTQFGHFSRVYASAGDQHMEALSHAGWCDQVFELQGHFRPLRRRTAFFKRVSKLVALTDAQ